MKNYLLTILFFISITSLSAQSLKKGNFIWTHIVTYELAEGVTFEQFENHFLNEFIPKYEEICPGWEFVLLKGQIGVYKDKMMVIIKMESAEILAKYYNADGTPTELRKEKGTELKPLYEKLNEYVTYTTELTLWKVL